MILSLPFFAKKTLINERHYCQFWVYRPDQQTSYRNYINVFAYIEVNDKTFAYEGYMNIKWRSYPKYFVLSREEGREAVEIYWMILHQIWDRHLDEKWSQISPPRQKKVQWILMGTKRYHFHRSCPQGPKFSLQSVVQLPTNYDIFSR